MLELDMPVIEVLPQRVVEQRVSKPDELQAEQDAELEGLLYEADEYINNALPIYMIYLPQHKLMKWDQVKQLLLGELSRHTGNIDKKCLFTEKFL